MWPQRHVQRTGRSGCAAARPSCFGALNYRRRTSVALRWHSPNPATIRCPMAIPNLIQAAARSPQRGGEHDHGAGARRWARRWSSAVPALAEGWRPTPVECRDLRPVIGASDRRTIALDGLLQDLLGARRDHPFEVVTIDPVEGTRQQRRTDGTHRF